MNWKPLIFWGLGIGIAAIAGLISSESAWNTPLLIVATILVMIGTVFGLGSSPKNLGYRLYQSSRYLSVKDFCKEILHIRRGNTTVVIQIDADGRLFVYENNTKGNSVTTDGKTDNQQLPITVLRIFYSKEELRLLDRGMWALFKNKLILSEDRIFNDFGMDCCSRPKSRLAMTV
jgi:hypothetical protein